MKHVFCTILFFIMAMLLTNAVNSVCLVVVVNPHDSGINPQYNYPANPVSEKLNTKVIISIGLLLLCIALINPAEAYKKKDFGGIRILERTSLPGGV
ncbi:hypothetical protein OAT93_00555 [bacterium]|nr:hypothetical protein [bacterium]